MVVIGKNNRAVLCGEWSKLGNKFVIGCGSCQAYIGFFDLETKSSWTSRKIASFLY